MRGEGAPRRAVRLLTRVRARARVCVSWLGARRAVADVVHRAGGGHRDRASTRRYADVARRGGRWCARRDVTGGREDAFESASGGRTSDSSAGSGFSSSTSAAASEVSVMARSAAPRRSARIATPSKAPLEPLRETDEVVRVGAATRAAAGAARAARLPATGARHKTLVAVTDAMVRCGLRASRAERLWSRGEDGGSPRSAGTRSCVCSISRIPDCRVALCGAVIGSSIVELTNRKRRRCKASD